MTTLTRDQVREINGLAEPVAFFAGVLGAKTYPKQDEILRSVVAHRRTSVVGCNGSGKDWTTGRLLLWWLNVHDQAKVIVMGPTNRQVDEIVWREARAAFKQAAQGGMPLAGRMYDGVAKYEIDTDRVAIGFATNEPYNITGFHSPHLLLIVTEAHAVSAEHITALKMLNPERIVMTGNALALTGEFFAAHESRAHSDYHAIRITADDTPNVIEGRVVIPGMMTSEDIEERKREWGEESPEYRASVLAEFTAGAGRNYFVLAAIEALATKVEPPRVELRDCVKIWRPPVVGGRYIAGADFAWGEKGAFDCMYIAEWRTMEMVAMVYGRLPDDEMAQECVDLLREYKGAYFGGEVNSEGRHVIDKMMELGYRDRMYHRDSVPDSLHMLENGQRPPKKPGWLTDSRTRPVMLREMEEDVRGGHMVVHDEGLIEEMKWFIRDEKNKPMPSPGHYSDRIMAWAVLRQMRDEATFSGDASRKPAYVRQA